MSKEVAKISHGILEMIYLESEYDTSGGSKFTIFSNNLNYLLTSQQIKFY
jgi:hypothetical protein